MNLIRSFQTPRARRIAGLALFVILLDHVTKAIVLRYLDHAEEKIIVPGFFKFVHWVNTGAAWSLFSDSNGILAIVAIVALVVLYLTRRQFDSKTMLGQTAFGLIVGGIIGNLIDRVFRGHVVDFLYFYLERRGGTELGFPAFNVADTAICTGVGLVFMITWRNEHAVRPAETTS